MAAVVTMNCTAKKVTIHSTEMTETMCLTVEQALTLFVAAIHSPYFLFRYKSQR